MQGILTLPLEAGKRYWRRDGTISEPLTTQTFLDDQILCDLGTNYVFSLRVPTVLKEPNDPKDLVADYHETRDGRPARILANDLKGTDYPVVAAIADLDGSEEVWTFALDGKFDEYGTFEETDLVTLTPPAPPFRLEAGKTYCEAHTGFWVELAAFVESRNIFIGFYSRVLGKEGRVPLSFSPDGTSELDGVGPLTELVE